MDKKKEQKKRKMKKQKIKKNNFDHESQTITNNKYRKLCSSYIRQVYNK